MTNEIIESKLSSERVACHSCPSSLIHLEVFKIASRTYKRENAYVKVREGLVNGWRLRTAKITVKQRDP